MQRHYNKVWPLLQKIVFTERWQNLLERKNASLFVIHLIYISCRCKFFCAETNSAQIRETQIISIPFFLPTKGKDGGRKFQKRCNKQKQSFEIYKSSQSSHKWSNNNETSLLSPLNTANFRILSSRQIMEINQINKQSW